MQVVPPPDLVAAIQSETVHIPSSTITRVSSELSDEYRRGAHSRQALRTTEHRLAYLATRMPATYSASLATMNELKRVSQDFTIESVLDISGGSGASTWAAAEAFTSVTEMSVVESDVEMAKIGQRLATHSQNDAVRRASWNVGDVTSLSSLPHHDLVIISYAIGEIALADQETLLREVWEATQLLCLVIEPGSRRGFENILTARSLLTRMGGAIIAPCPGNVACPMTDGADWCHFSQRLVRDAIHRRAKQAALPFEDEKFSYVATAKNSVRPNLQSRILRSPRKHRRLVSLDLCTRSGRTQVQIPKSRADAYRLARKVDWGGAISDEIALTNDGAA